MILSTIHLQTLKTMRKFIEKTYSEEQLKDLTEFISFNKMKTNKAINREDVVIRMETRNGKKRLDTDYK